MTRHIQYKKAQTVRLLEPGNAQPIHERFLLEYRVLPVSLHLCDVPICRVVPGGGRACVNNHVRAMTSSLRYLPESQSARPDVR